MILSKRGMSLNLKKFDFSPEEFKISDLNWLQHTKYISPVIV